MADFKQLTSEDFTKLKEIVDTLETDLNNKQSNWYTDNSEYCGALSRNYEAQFSKVPAILNIINNTTNKFNKSSCERLKFMITQASRVFNKDIAEHDASVAVGTKLVDEIVKPQLNK